MPELKILNAENLDAFTDQEHRVLVLGKSSCNACNQWQAEIEEAMGSGDFPEIPIGKLNLDQRGLADFKRDNEWLKEIKDLPFNVIYKSGARVKSYTGAGVGRLVNRLQKLELI